MAESKKDPLSLQRRPQFRTEGVGDERRVFLHCSECLARIREIEMQEPVDLRVAHYCKDCDPGVVLLNTGTPVH